METSPILRFRIDKEIAERAHKMAHAIGMDLPDVVRMMLTKAVRIGSLSIDAHDEDHGQAKELQRPDPFNPRYWGPYRTTIDADLALALLRQRIADATADGERQEASRLLEELDVSDPNAVATVLKQDGARDRSQAGAAAAIGSMTKRRPTRTERDRFIAEVAIPDLLASASPSATPAAIVVLGQPGAGVAVAAAELRREMRRSTGAAVGISLAQIHSIDPTLSAAGAQRWLRKAVDVARTRRVHLVLEDELNDPPHLMRLVASLRKDGYVIQVVGVCVPPQVSRLMLVARTAMWHAHGLAPDRVSAEQHDTALDSLRATLAGLEEGHHVDGVRLITPEGRQLYENRWAGSAWLRAPRAAAVMNKELSRALPDKDAVQLAMCWDTVCRSVVNQPGVPRDVASQVLTWRNAVIAQCEASASKARMLGWACEGAAFREMDRFAFEAAFPHHARASALMGAAVIEAETLEAAEAQRFLSNARENIAQRIERGDMARIADRAAKSRKPSKSSLEQNVQEDPMPTTIQKASTLVRAGVVLPGHPSVDASDAAVAAWNRQVDNLFAAYVMTRAARSLREAEETQQRSQMRQINAQLGQDEPGPRGQDAEPEE